MTSPSRHVNRLAPPEDPNRRDPKITPEDIRNKRFTPVRLREGYSMEEVDQFLDDLGDDYELLLNRSRAAQVAPAPDPTPAQPTPAVVRTIPEASGAAARLLELAARDSEELATETKRRCEQELRESRERIQVQEQQARQRAQSLDAEAQGRSRQVDREIKEKRDQLLNGLESQRGDLQREVDRLTHLSQEMRERLHSHLRHLDSQVDNPDAAQTRKEPPR